ncbi:unnamed protein product [Vicia faba]|uniref:Secreted protein n=1 Tax=Vicia faba TaxID=3906 RepID=A0AAV0Z8A1_VICFA|nr:unnamed protein product [Vicia faba]
MELMNLCLSFLSFYPCLYPILRAPLCVDYRPFLCPLGEKKFLCSKSSYRPSKMAVEQLARGAQPRCQCPFCSRVFAIFCHSSTLKWLDHCLRVRLRNSGFEYREVRPLKNPPRIIDSSLLIQGRSDAKNCFLSYPFTRKKGLKQCVHGHSEHRIFGIKERVGQVREGRAG